MSETTRPIVFSTTAAIRAGLMPARRAGQRIGLVPTMGALHAGHLSLVAASQAQCDVSVVWIYVNPSQFGPNDDLSKYPRTLESDLDQLTTCQSEVKTLLVFAPADEEVYKPNHGTWVEPLGVAEPLEGPFRPGHFRGVATVVLKMFNMVQPHCAFFGQKDFQQVRVIQQMVADLDVDTEIVVCPIVREKDGLAMSSRNIYLNASARAQAVSISRSLELARRLVSDGEKSAAKIVARMTDLIVAAGPVQIDYIALVEPQTLRNVATVSAPTVAAIAVRIAGTRLIDNCPA